MVLDLKSTEPTVLTSWALAIARTIRSYNVDPKPLLNEAGIDSETLGQYGARVTVAKTNHLWKLAVTATGDPAIGLRLPQYTTQSILYSLDVALQVSATPRDMLDCFIRFSEVASTSVTLSLELDCDSPRLLFAPAHPRSMVKESIDAFIAFLIGNAHRLFVEIGGFYIGVRMMRARPDSGVIYEQVLGCPVEFDCNEYSILIDQKQLDTPLPTANPEMARWCEKMLVEYVVKMEKENIEERVRQTIAKQLSFGGVNRQVVAATMNMSERSLSRRLAENSLGFQAILDEIREEMACNLLACKDVSQIEIAMQLGFADTSSFVRTFKRWTGVTPGIYRRKSA